MKARRALTVALAALLLAGVAGAAFWRFGRPLPVPVVTAADGAVALRIVGPATLQARVAVTRERAPDGHGGAGPRRCRRLRARGQLLVLLDDREQSAPSRRHRRPAGSAGAQHRGGPRRARQGAGRPGPGARQAAPRRRPAAPGFRLAGRPRRLRRRAAGRRSRRRRRASDAGGARGRRAQRWRRRHATPTPCCRMRASSRRSTASSCSAWSNPAAPSSPGTPMLKLVDPKTLWAATRVDESVVGRVQLGQAASIRMRSGELLAGKVARIARQSDAATREMDVTSPSTPPPQRFAIDQEAEVTIDVGRGPRRRRAARRAGARRAAGARACSSSTAGARASSRSRPAAPTPSARSSARAWRAGEAVVAVGAGRQGRPARAAAPATPDVADPEAPAMELALKDIRRHLGKFLATIVGVAMLLAIVLRDERHLPGQHRTTASG